MVLWRGKMKNKNKEKGGPMPEETGNEKENTEPEEQDIEIIGTEKLVDINKPFMILRDKIKDGKYGYYHSLLISFKDETPMIWNTRAWQIHEISKNYRTPVEVHSLKWKSNGVKKTLEVETDELYQKGL